MHDLDLALRDPYGNELAADATVTSAPAVRACANANGEWIAEAYAFDGYGAYGLQVFAGPR